MAFGFEPIKKRGSKKKPNWKKYNQKTTKKTKENIKNRSWVPKASKPQKTVTVHSPVMQSGGGSRVGQKTENKSIDSAKKAVKSVIKSLAKKEKTPKLSQARLNNTTGGRAGQKTERVKFTPYKMNTKGLDDKTAGHKQRFQQSFRSGLQTGGRSFLKAEKSGAYSSKMTNKEKKAVVKSIEKDYNKKAKDGRKAFVAGLTKSDVNVETATKALFGKKANTKKVKKTGAYKAGDVVQEIGSYAIAPEGAITEALGKKALKAGAKKILKKEATKTAEKATEKAAKELAKKVVKDETKKAGKAVANKVTKKEAKSAAKKLAEKTSPDVAKKLLKQEAKATSKAIDKKLSTKEAKEAFRIIADKGVKKGSEKAVTNAGNAAVKEVKEKAVREAIKESGKQVMGSKLKSQAVKRGGDVIANAPLNARYAVSHADEARKENKEAELKQLNRSFKKGKVSQEDYATRKAAIKKKYSSLDMGDVAKDFLLNTGLDVGVGGGIDAVVGKARKIKKANLKRIKKYESQIKGGMTREGKKRAARAAERAEEREAIKAASTLKKGVGNKQGRVKPKKPDRHARFRTEDMPPKAVKGKRVASAEALSRGKVIKRAFDRIDKLEAAKKISRRQAKQERKALTKAVESMQGGVGIATRSEKGIQFAKATKRGLQEVDKNEYGKALTIDKRFGGTAKRLTEKSEPVVKQADEVAERTDNKVKEGVKVEQPKATEKSPKQAMKEIHKRYGFSKKAQKEIEEAASDYVNNRDPEKLLNALERNAPKTVERDKIANEYIEVASKTSNASKASKASNASEASAKLAETEKANGKTQANETLRTEAKEATAAPKKEKDWVDELDEDIAKAEEAEKKRADDIVNADKERGKIKDTTTHKGKEDDTITAADDETMADVDSVLDRKEARTTHDDNLTDTGKAAREKAKSDKEFMEQREDKLFDEAKAKSEVGNEKAQREATERLYAEGKAKENTAEGTETAPTAEKTSKSSNVSTDEKTGLKSLEKDEDDIFAAPEKQSAKASINNWSTGVYRKVVDSLGFTDKAAREFAKTNNLPEFSKRMTGNLNNLRQSAQQAAYSYEKEQIDVNGRRVGESGLGIVNDMKKKGTYDDVQRYLYLMNHADRLDNAKRTADGDVLMRNGELLDKRIYPNKTAEQARKEAEEIIKNNPEVFEDAKRVIRYFRNDLRSQMLSGMISKDTFYHYIDTYPNYVPAHRTPYSMGGGTKGINGKSAVEYGAKGSDEKVLPLEYQMKIQTDNTFMRSATNDVARQVAEMSGTPSSVYDFLTNEAKVDPLDTATYFDTNEGKLRFTENGEWKEVSVDKNFLKDLKDFNTNYGKDSVLFKGFSKFNRAFKALITSYSPTFVVRNFFRDAPEGLFQSESMRHYAKNFPLGFSSIVKNDDWYRAYVRMGGAHAQFINPAEVFNKRWTKFNPFQKIERINEITEQIPRMAEFRGYLEKLGVTPQTATVNQLRQASNAAADVTVNFGRSGSIGRMLNSGLIPFFNPAIQGADKLARVITRDKTFAGFAKLGIKTALLGVSPAMFNEMMLSDNKHYKELTPRDRMTNFYIPLDKDNPIAKLFGSNTIGAKDDELLLQIPKARWLSVIGALSQKASGNLKDAGTFDIVGFGIDQVGPVGVTNFIGMPIINTALNRTWYGGKIDSDWEVQNLPASERYNANTSEISIGLAKFAKDVLGKEISPKRIDNIIDSYGGFGADVALGLTTKAAKRSIGAQAFSRDSVLQSNAPTQYYEAQEKLRKAGNSKYASKKDKKAFEKFSSWDDRIKQVNGIIANVQDSNNKNKEKTVRELTRIRNNLMKNAVSGKKADYGTGDVKKIANIMGAKSAFKMIASDADKKAAKQYGKVDKKFINGVLAMKDISSGRNISNEAKAVALLSSGAGKKAAKAYGLLHKGTNDMETPYDRAKNYFKNGGSVEEYKSMQKAIKAAKIDSTDYTGKAATLARMGASDRLYKLYDIKDYKVRLGRNMAALGITSKDLDKHKTRAFGGSRANDAQARSYVAGLNKSKAEKSVILGALAWWVDKYNKNPYGTVNASRKDAMDKKFRSKYVSGKVSKANAGKGSPEGWVTPHVKGYQIDPITKKRIPNGKTAGSIGERIQLPAGRNLADLLKDEKAGKIKKVTIEERLHNAFGSRIGDVKKKKVFLPTTIKEVKKDKKGNVDITFANGEVWRNPPSKKPKDNTKLESSGTGGGRGYRRWGRGWRSWGRGGYGGSGGGRGTATVKNFEPSLNTGSGGSSFALKPYEKPPYNPKKVTYKKQTLSRPSRSAATTVKSRSIDTNLSRPSENTKIQTSRINTSLPDIGTEKVSTKATYKKINPAVKSVYKSRAKKASAVKEKRAKANVSIKKARDVYGIRRKRK